MTPLQELEKFGQSIRYDNVSRKLERSGELQALMADSVNAVTSNPAIFEQAINRSDLYDDDIRKLAPTRTAAQIFRSLAVDDIRRACDIMRSVYDATEGGDGFVSIEVSPQLANDTDGTVAEAKSLWAEIDRPNLMIKIPANLPGVRAIRCRDRRGHQCERHVPFLCSMYAKVAAAYIVGLEDRPDDCELGGIARRDIRYNVKGIQRPMVVELAGPGMLDIEAGRNINFQSQRITMYISQTGIRTIGNVIDSLAAPVGQSITNPTSMQFGNPYLPRGGATVNVLFGVALGMDYASFASTYVNPANGISAIADEPTLLVGLVQSYEQTLGKAPDAMTADQAWTIFQAMPKTWQHIVEDKIFLDVLNETGLDYNQPSSSHYHQYARGYQAINTLYPASYGYTQNGLGGGTNGANSLVVTGNLDMRGSTIQSQQGGDISVFGPGGRILVGSSTASPSTNPASEGILTLEKGNIATFTNTDVLVAQSRVMTEQGGSILMWSSNGNLDAGKGAKTSVSAPPPLYDCDIDFHCTVDIKGAVSGAGIATLQSLPSVPVGDANLVAPRGTVDAGAAGIRTSGNLNIAAFVIANSFNIEVQGKTFGIPEPVTNLSLATASTAATDAAAITQSLAAQQPRIDVEVEVTGYGGTDAEHPERCISSATNHCPPDSP